MIVKYRSYFAANGKADKELVALRSVFPDGDLKRIGGYIDDEIFVTVLNLVYIKIKAKDYAFEEYAEKLSALLQQMKQIK